MSNIVITLSSSTVLKCKRVHYIRRCVKVFPGILEKEGGIHNKKTLHNFRKSDVKWGHGQEVTGCLLTVGWRRQIYF